MIAEESIEGAGRPMINQQNYKDLMIIRGDGRIIYADVSNPQYFGVGIDGLRGKRLQDMYPDLPGDYPALLTAQNGTAAEDFEVELTTVKGIRLTKRGSVYPIYENNQVVAALELSTKFYDRNHIREIEGNADHLIYRKNNTKYLIDDIITEDAAMAGIKEKVEKFALTDATVLIYGETGTGKELVAQTLHNGSRRYARNFISVNCSAIPASIMESVLFGTVKGSFTGAEDKAGLFEQAEGGTLFLDEINSLDALLQVKILKAVESKTVRRIGSLREKQVDVRIIAATNEDPYRLMREGKLKPDLFHRLAAVYLVLPRLSDRRGDIMVLADYFRTYFNRNMNMNIGPFDDDIRQLFMNYDWPGNVRELRNVIESAFAFAENDRITMDDIPKYMANKMGVRKPMGQIAGDGSLTLAEKTDLMEKAIIDSIYRKNKESLTETARELGISKQLLRYKMMK